MKLRTTLLLLALAAPGLAWGEVRDPPGRLAHLAYVEGRVTFTSAQERAISTLPDRPLAPGDRINTGPGGRAEFAFGSATIHLDEESTLAIVELDEQAVRLNLSAGAMSLNLRDLLEDETFEIETPNAGIALIEPGEYRVDVDADDASVLTVRGGVAEITTAGGPVRIAGDQRARLEGRDAIARLETPRPADEFDEWVLNREVRVQVADAEPARFTPYEGEEYEELDRYGEWYDEPRYGRVWMPADGYSNWSPYYGGHWQQVGLGWGWYDPVPWGYYTNYNGRWAYLRDRNRWCWVPTRAHPRHHARDTRPFVHPRRHAPERARPDASERTADTRQVDEDRNPRVAPPSAAPRRTDPDRRHPRLPEPRPSPPVAAPPPPDAGATMPPARTEPARTEWKPDRAQNKREYGARPEP